MCVWFFFVCLCVCVCFITVCFMSLVLMESANSSHVKFILNHFCSLKTTFTCYAMLHFSHLNVTIPPGSVCRS
jgi:hypothetical protein